MTYLKKILKTAYIIGEFSGDLHRNDTFHEFAAQVADQPKAADQVDLKYDAFVEHFGIRSDLLGNLDSSNPFFNFLKPYSPPEGVPPQASSEMAAQVIDAIPSQLRSFASQLYSIGEAINEEAGGHGSAKNPLAFVSLLGMCVDKARRDKFSKEFDGRWSDSNGFDTAGLESREDAALARQTVSAFASYVRKETLFFSLVRRYIWDAVNDEVGRAAEALRRQLVAAGLSAQDDKGLLPLASENSTSKFIYALTRRDATVLQPGDFNCRNHNLALTTTGAFLKTYQGMKESLSRDTAESEKFLKTYLSEKATEWKKNHNNKDMPELATLRLQVAWRSYIGVRSITEDLLATVLSSALENMVFATNASAQQTIAAVRAKYSQRHKVDSPTWKGKSDEEVFEDAKALIDREEWPQIENEFSSGTLAKVANQLCALVCALVYLACDHTVAERDEVISLLCVPGLSGELANAAASAEWKGKYQSLVDKASKIIDQRAKTAEEGESAQAKRDISEGASDTSERVRSRAAASKSQTVAAVDQASSSATSEPASISPQSHAGSTPVGTSSETIAQPVDVTFACKSGSLPILCIELAGREPQELTADNPKATIPFSPESPTIRITVNGDGIASLDRSYSFDDLHSNPTITLYPRDVSVALSFAKGIPTPSVLVDGNPVALTDNRFMVHVENAAHTVHIDIHGDGIARTSLALTVPELCDKTNIFLDSDSPKAELAFLDRLLESAKVEIDDRGQRLRKLVVTNEMVTTLHETLGRVFSYASQNSLDDTQANAVTSAEQYLLVLNLARHGIQFGDPDLAPLAWLLHLNKYRSKKAVLENEALSSFYKCSKWEDILEARKALNNQINRDLATSKKLLSRLYGMEVLLRSVAADRDVRLLIWNGDAGSAIKALSGTGSDADAFNPKTLSSEHQERVPSVIYFVDAQSSSGFLGSLESRMPPCLIDAGPDFVNDSSTSDAILHTHFPACVSLVGPGLRLRGVANRMIANDGKPDFPLIPAGFILLAAALGGKNVEPNEQLRPTDATGAIKRWNTFPQITLDNKIRYRLDQSANSGKGGQDAIEAAREVLSWTSGFAADLCVWLLRVKVLSGAETEPIQASSRESDLPWQVVDGAITFHFPDASNKFELTIDGDELIQMKNDASARVDVSEHTARYISLTD